MSIRRIVMILGVAFFSLLSHSNARADQIICTATGSGLDKCDILLPNVLQPTTAYPSLQLAAGDTVMSVSADGCVQTGGTGSTWKQYLTPDPRDLDSNNPGHLYHGLIQFPGGPLVRLRDEARLAPFISSPLTASGPLVLGYEDNGYSDNGYYSHDDGTNDQCKDVTGSNRGRAAVHIEIQRAATPFLPAGTVYGQCVSAGANQLQCHIDRPDTTQAVENYPSIQFLPDDQVTIQARGCAQTGGSFNTWKRYVDPNFNTSDPRQAYSGLVSIPGATNGLVRISSVLGKTLTSTGGTLQLGYVDDHYGDNGYWSHDDGTDEQCHNSQNASLDITITHAGMPLGEHVNLDGIEITQAIQDMNHSVPLVAGKPTWVRVYVSGTIMPGPQVTGTLVVDRYGFNAGSVTVQAPIMLTNSTLRARREAWSGSLNFLLPASLTTAGGIDVYLSSIVTTSSHAPIPCNLCGNKTYGTFVTVPPLRLRLIGLSYNAPVGGGQTVFAPAQADFNLLQSWLGRAYPVSQIYATRTTIAGNVAPPFVNDGPATWSCQDADSFISGIRANEVSNGVDPNTHYYGLVSDTNSAVTGSFFRGCSDVPDSPDPSAIGSGPAGQPPGPQNVAYGDTDASYADWYAGHELGHTFGRKHPGFCDGNTHDDPNFPFPNGFISDSGGSFVGLDTGDAAFDINGAAIAVGSTSSAAIPLKVIPGQVGTEIMSYCAQPQWLSSYTYEGILNRILAEHGQPGVGAGPSGGADSDADNSVHVTATIDLTAQTGKIKYVFPVHGAARDVERRKPSGDNVEIVALDREGKILARYPVEAKLLSEHTPQTHQAALVDVSIPITPDLAGIQLVVRKTTVDEFHADMIQPPSPRSPQFETQPLLDHRKLAEPRIRLQWSAPRGFEASTAITYMVEMLDDDKQWHTLALGLRTPSVFLTLDQVRSQLRVTATNGFRNSPPLLVKMP